MTYTEFVNFITLLAQFLDALKARLGKSEIEIGKVEFALGCCRLLQDAIWILPPGEYLTHGLLSDKLMDVLAGTAGFVNGYAATYAERCELEIEALQAALIPVRNFLFEFHMRLEEAEYLDALPPADPSWAEYETFMRESALIRSDIGWIAAQICKELQTYQLPVESERIQRRLFSDEVHFRAQEFFATGEPEACAAIELILERSPFWKLLLDILNSRAVHGEISGTFSQPLRQSEDVPDKALFAAIEHEYRAVIIAVELCLVLTGLFQMDPALNDQLNFHTSLMASLFQTAQRHFETQPTQSKEATEWIN